MDYTRSGVLIREGFHRNNGEFPLLSSNESSEVYGRVVYETTESDPILFNTTTGYMTNGTGTYYDDYVPYLERPETYIVPVLFFIIFVIGVLGNGTLIAIFLKHRTMRNVPNIYICSLAVGDILVIFFCVPFTSTVYTVESWPYGVLVCKFSEFIKDVSIGVSVFTLTALSADRYFAIVDPMRKLTGCGATRVTFLTITGIWILSVLIALPSALFSYIRVIDDDPEHTFHVCYPFPPELTPIYPKVMVMFKFLVYYAIPLFFIATFYIVMARHLVLSTKNMPGEAQGQGKQIQARKKVAKMVLSFVVIFAMCFFPSHVFLLWFYFDPNSEENFNAFWNFVRIIGFCLGFINSCINPITLYCLSGTFRKYFNRHLFCCGQSESDRGGGNRARNFFACGAGCASMSNSAQPAYTGHPHVGFNTESHRSRNGVMGGLRSGGGVLYRGSTTTNYTVSVSNKNRCNWESHRDIQMTNLNVANLEQQAKNGPSPRHLMQPSTNFPLTSISLSSTPNLSGAGQIDRYGVLPVSPKKSPTKPSCQSPGGMSMENTVLKSDTCLKIPNAEAENEEVTVTSFTICEENPIRIANISEEDDNNKSS